MHAGGQMNANLAHDGVLVPIAGGGNLQRAGHVGSIDFHVERAALGDAGHAEVERIRAGGGDGHGVVEIFTGEGPADEVVTAAGAGDGTDADAIVGAIQAAAIEIAGVVVAGVWAAKVEVLGLDSTEGAGEPLKGPR